MFSSCKTKVRDIIEIREIETSRRKVDEEEHLKRGHRNENIPARPNKLHEKLDTVILGRGPGLAGKKKEACQ